MTTLDKKKITKKENDENIKVKNTHIHSDSGFRCLVAHPDGISCKRCECGEYFR